MALVIFLTVLNLLRAVLGLPMDTKLYIRSIEKTKIRKSDFNAENTKRRAASEKL